MATYPKFADNEMNYYQYKAQQMVQQEKEDQEWKDFCKQSASECAACSAENESVKESRDIGIQAFPRIVPNRTDFAQQTFLQPRYQNKQAEELNHIKNRLEKIDLTLSNLVDVPHEAEKKKKPATEQISSQPYLPGFSGSFEEQRKSFIRSSLKECLLNAGDAKCKFPNRTADIKLKNSGFVLPHDLQVKRASARRAYLASLQTKPKVTFQNEKKSSVKQPQPINITIPQTRKKISLKILKKPKGNDEVKTEVCATADVIPRNKISIKILKKPKGNDEVKTEVCATADTKDENIEKVLDELLGDLFTEVALDLSNIIKQKIKLYSSQNITFDVEKENDSHIPTLTSELIQNLNSEIDAKDASKGSTNLKSFFTSSIAPQQEKNDLREEQLVPKSASNRSTILERMQRKNREMFLSHRRMMEIVQNKFIFEVPHKITIDPAKAEEISLNRDKYWGYLAKISRICSENINPRSLNEMLAEDILDGCLFDIAQELSENLAIDFYKQEFKKEVQS